MIRDSRHLWDTLSQITRPIGQQTCASIWSPAWLVAQAPSHLPQHTHPAPCGQAAHHQTPKIWPLRRWAHAAVAPRSWPMSRSICARCSHPGSACTTSGRLARAPGSRSSASTWAAHLRPRRGHRKWLSALSTASTSKPQAGYSCTYLLWAAGPAPSQGRSRSSGRGPGDPAGPGLQYKWMEQESGSPSRRQGAAGHGHALEARGRRVVGGPPLAPAVPPHTSALRWLRLGLALRRAL